MQSMAGPNPSRLSRGQRAQWEDLFQQQQPIKLQRPTPVVGADVRPLQCILHACTDFMANASAAAAPHVILAAECMPCLHMSHLSIRDSSERKVEARGSLALTAYNVFIQRYLACTAARNGWALVHP